MKCENCKISIGAEFSHAINNNQCPACGKSIMQKAKLASYLSLRTLLENHIVGKDVDIDKLSSLIVANFELKQLFNTDSPTIEKDIEVEDDDGDKEVSEEEEEEDPDAEYKAKQIEESKKILQKLRDEAFEGAIEERYGFEDTGILINDDANMHEIVNNEIKKQSRDTILTGAGGAFRRG